MNSQVHIASGRYDQEMRSDQASAYSWNVQLFAQLQLLGQFLSRLLAMKGTVESSGEKTVWKGNWSKDLLSMPLRPTGGHVTFQQVIADHQCLPVTNREPCQPIRPLVKPLLHSTSPHKCPSETLTEQSLVLWSAPYFLHNVQ